MAGRSAFADESAVAATDEQALKAVGLKADGPTLLEFFKVRAAGKADKDAVAGHVKALADKDAAVRDKAMASLVSLGHPAVPRFAKPPMSWRTPKRPPWHAAASSTSKGRPVRRSAPLPCGPSLC